MTGQMCPYILMVHFAANILPTTTFAILSFVVNQVALYCAFFRSELGKRTLDHVFRERESLNTTIVDAINIATESWGIKCKRYEISEYIPLPV